MIRLVLAIALQGLASTAVCAQVYALPVPLPLVCGPETVPTSTCKEGEEGLATLRGSQLELARGLARLSSGATVSDIQRLVGSPPVSHSAGGTALLDGKRIERRISRWNLKWDSSLSRPAPQDQTLVAVFANDLLMNLKVGGTETPGVSLFFSALDCEPDCDGKLRMLNGVK